MRAISELDAIIEQPLRSFYQDICSDWGGRENEMVNLFAHSHLAKYVKPDTILSDLGQIGIEVTVQQLPKEVLLKWNPKAEKPKKDVRKDNVTAYYMHKDWLGNSRISSVIVNPSVVSDQAYAPYSEVYNKVNTGAAVPGQMFTGDTQDIVSGIFDTPNRELNSSQGRWLSPDPAGAGWNQYAYATNPNSYADPTGLTPALYYCPNDSCNGHDQTTGGGGSGSGIIMGNDIFDAVEGAPGTYLYTNMYGQTTFGFSAALWAGTLDMIDSVMQEAANNNMVGLPYPTSGFQLSVQDSGTDLIMSGLLVEYQSAVMQTGYLTQLVLGYVNAGQSIPSSLETQLTASQDRQTYLWSQIIEIILPGFSKWNP